MNKERILIVEDNKEWISNFRRWLGNDYSIEEALTAGLALDMLKTGYYALVLLDLSLHPTDPGDRTSEEIQKYLKNISEGTKHIIISGHADKDDVRRSTLKYGAFNVFFKDDDFEDITAFLESVKDAVFKSKQDRPNFSKDSYDVFCGNNDKGILEYKILQVLKPKNGVNGWFSFKEELFDAISPIYNHVSRTEIKIEEKCILGLFWSRKMGSAFTICLANVGVSEDECVNSVANWLGWPHTSGKGINFESNNIRGFVFIEPDLGPEDFIL